MNRQIKILLADDHQVVRMGLAAIIAAESDMHLVGEASDGAEAVALTRKLTPDVVLMDLRMPQKDGASATADILAVNPDAKILVLTTFGESDEVKRARFDGSAMSARNSSSLRRIVVALNWFVLPAICARRGMSASVAMDGVALSSSVCR